MLNFLFHALYWIVGIFLGCTIAFSSILFFAIDEDLTKKDKYNRFLVVTIIICFVAFLTLLFNNRFIQTTAKTIFWCYVSIAYFVIFLIVAFVINTLYSLSLKRFDKENFGKSIKLFFGIFISVSIPIVLLYGFKKFNFPFALELAQVLKYNYPKVSDYVPLIISCDLALCFNFLLYISIFGLRIGKEDKNLYLDLSEKYYPKWSFYWLALLLVIVITYFSNQNMLVICSYLFLICFSLYIFVAFSVLLFLVVTIIKAILKRKKFLGVYYSMTFLICIYPLIISLILLYLNHPVLTKSVILGKLYYKHLNNGI